MEENNSKGIECPLCLQNVYLPVSTSCGHIFCWRCLKSWLDSQSKMTCPICKNGIKYETITKLHLDGYVKPGDVDDRPHGQRIDPVSNNQYPNIFKRMLNSLGFYGSTGGQNMPLPDEKEVKRNRLAMIFLLIGIVLVFTIFR